MMEFQFCIADLIEAIQDVSENDAQVMAALLHLLLDDESGVALGA